LDNDRGDEKEMKCKYCDNYTSEKDGICLTCKLSEEAIREFPEDGD